MIGNMIGKVFNNRYQITERIGIGGMAEVYRAQDNVLGRMVAVKTMLPQYAADQNFTARFKQEAAAAANLQSPYIVNVYDWGQDDGTYYIVMEFVRGSDLKTAINERGAINQRKVAEIGSQVCQALAVAHNLDIIHRDIKPQNIMVQPDGNVKVMDFGIARAKNSVMTQTSSVLGTAHYISPEQAQGKELTATSDLYSLGIVLYESATGKLPFDGPDAVNVAMKQVNDLPIPPREINPEIDPALEAIIMKAMAKNPADRFATAQDMRYALNDYLAGRPVGLGGFTGAETAVMGGLAAGAAANDGTAVMPATGNGVNPATPAGAKNYRSDNTKKGSSKKKVAIVIAILVALALVGVGAYALMGGFDSGDPVPDVTGMTVEEAQSALEAAGFELGTQDTVYDDEVESGKIISQDPAANTRRESGTKINITVSQGPEQVTVPDLTNMTADQLQEELDKLGLQARAGTAKYSADIPVNRVIEQSPAAGERVAKGTTVTYVLSLGTEDVSVPNVVNYSQSEAIRALNAAGFEANVQTQSSDSVGQGYVISQNPSSGAKLTKGSSVTIYVSSGPEPEPSITIPFVADGNYTVASATSTLQAAGFNVSVRGSQESTAIVVSQDPTGTGKRGDTITITAEAVTPDPPSNDNPNTNNATNSSS